MPESVKVNRKRHTLMLTVTEACNLRCVYCYEIEKTTAGNHLERTLSFDIAMREVREKFASLNPETDELEIQFHGGEPFLSFDLIKNLCEWVWMNDWPVPYIFYATTNGTILNVTSKQWLTLHKGKFCVGLSIDGTPEMQNANRSKSFTKLDLEFHKTNWPRQPAKMTVSSRSISTLAEGVIFLHTQGFDVHCGFAFGFDWGNSDCDNTLARELKKLIDFYCANPEIKPCDLLDLDLRPVGAFIEKNREPRKKWCGIGEYITVVDVDGYRYPCHLLMPFSSGRDEIDLHKKWSFNDPDALSDPLCMDCCLLPVCPSCYAMSALQFGNPSRKDKKICQFQKIRAMASAKLNTQRILKCLETNDYSRFHLEEIRLVIRAIQEINSAFSTI